VTSSASAADDSAAVSCVEIALAFATEDVNILSAAAEATGAADVGQGRAGLRRWLTELEAQGRRARLSDAREEAAVA
jgi:hypothetical protein